MTLLRELLDDLGIKGVLAIGGVCGVIGGLTWLAAVAP